MSILDRYVRPGQQPMRAPDKETGNVVDFAPASSRPTASLGRDGYILNIPQGGWDYAAFSAPAEQQPHFVLIANKTQGIMCRSYDRLTCVDGDPGGTWILLVFLDDAFLLKGRDLLPLLPPVLDKRTEMIIEFDSRKHRALQEDKPIITEIALLQHGRKRGKDGQERAEQELGA